MMNTAGAETLIKINNFIYDHLYWTLFLFLVISFLIYKFYRPECDDIKW